LVQAFCSCRYDDGMIALFLLAFMTPDQFVEIGKKEEFHFRLLDEFTMHQGADAKLTNYGKFSRSWMIVE
jgi:hypothetical protein